LNRDHAACSTHTATILQLFFVFTATVNEIQVPGLHEYTEVVRDFELTKDLQLAYDSM